MNPRIIGNTFSALILSILLSLLLHHEFLRRTQMTRQEFLAKETARYDKQIARPTPFAVTLTMSIFLGAAVFGAYELVGLGISKLAGKADAQNQVS